jgi:hypothetical protein
MMKKPGTRSEENDHTLTDEHLRLFGAIVHSFAQYELVIQRGLAGVLEVDVGLVPLLTKDLDFVQKRSALLDLLRERQFPNDVWDTVFAHLAVATCRVALRDQIVHATWKASPDPHSIQPNWILRIHPASNRPIGAQ